MASSRGFLRAIAASVASGSKIVTVKGGVNCSYVSSGTAVFLSENLLEGVSGTAANPDGTSTITLRDAWTGVSLVDKPMVSFNTIEGLRDAIQDARGFATVMTSMTKSFGDILTSTAQEITVDIEGVPTKITPYGYLSGEVAKLIASAGSATATLTALQQDVATLTSTVAGIQADLASKVSAAAASVLKAEAWAIKPENSEVVTGKYSSLHWAAKSQGFSVASQSYKDLSQKWAESPEGTAVVSGKYSALHWSAKSQASSVASSGFRDTAQKWSEGAVGVPVVVGKYSAMHWSSKSQGFSAASAASAVRSDEWANKVTDSVVEGGRFSSKHWSDKSKDQTALANKWAEAPENTAVVTGKFSSLHWSAKSQAYSVQSKGYRDSANKWADFPVDMPVVTGKFSAMHWSEKAKAQAVIAASYGSSGFSDGGNVDLSGGSFPAKPAKATIYRISAGGTVSGILYKAGETLAYSKAADIFYRLEVLAGTSWGAVTGTLANQTDLKNALDAKAAQSSVDTALLAKLDKTAKATKFEAEAGTNDTKWMSSLKVNNAIQQLVKTATKTIAGIVMLTDSFTIGDATKAASGRALKDGLATKLGNTGLQRIVTGETSAITSTTSASLEVNQQHATKGDALMTFHITGVKAGHLGLSRATGKFSVGGGSFGANDFALYHEGNKPTAKELGAVASATVSLTGGSLAGQCIKAGRYRVSNPTSSVPSGYALGNCDFWVDSFSLHGLPSDSSDAGWVRLIAHDLRSNRTFQRCRFNAVWETKWREIEIDQEETYFSATDSTKTFSGSAMENVFTSIIGTHTVNIPVNLLRVGATVIIENAGDACVVTNLNFTGGTVRLIDGTNESSSTLTKRSYATFRKLEVGNELVLISVESE